MINFSKSHLEPSSKCKYLDFIFDSNGQSIAANSSSPSEEVTMLNSKFGSQDYMSQ